MSEADDTSADPITDTEKSSVATIPPESKSPLIVQIVQEESNGQFKESVDPINVLPSIRQSGSSNRPLIRYTKEQLLALRESPLVKKPDRLPSMNTWYGEIIKKDNKKTTVDSSTLDNDKSKQSNYNLGDGSNKTKDDANTLGIPKSPLLTVQKSPGSSAPTSPKPSDKIVLGPPKMNFASSSIGGLKIAEDKSAAVPSRAARTDGIRQRQGEENGSLLRSTGKDFEPRAPRGPTGGRGFVGRENLRQKLMSDKSSKDINESRDARDMREMRDTSTLSNGAHHSRMTGSSLRTQDLPRGNRREHSGVGGKENLVKSETTEKGRARSVSRADSSISWRAENKYIVGSDEDSVNNISLEIKESSNKEKQLTGFEVEQPSNVDQLFGRSGIDLELGSSDAFDKFYKEHKLAMIGGDAATEIPAIGGGRKNEYGAREQPTSRFAKFFNHNEDENLNAERNVNEKSKGISLISQNHSSTNELLHSAPISLDALFQSQVNVTTASPRAIPNDGKRMLSEAEVLQSLGAKTTVSKNDYNEQNPEDVMGFNKILAALAKGNSSETQRQYTSPNAPTGIGSSIQSLSNEPLSHATGIPFNDPSIIMAQKHHTHTKGMQQQSKYEPIHRQMSVGGVPDMNASDSAKKLNMLFGNNVPTSVYRQLSTKSDGGSRESSASSSPALKLKPIISNYPHSPNIPQPANLQDHHHLPQYKSSPRPRSPILSQQQGLDPSHYHNFMSSYSNNLNVHQHTHAHPEFPPLPPLGRNIPVEQLFGMIPSRNPPQQIHPQYQQAPPQIPFGYQQHQADRYQQQLPFSGHQIPQQFSVHPHHAILPPSTETALFANMHGYAQFIPNLVNNAIAPNNITGLPPNNNLQQRGMTSLEEIERRGGLGGR
ncbi:1078_t:CDS:10 [Ambispora leptoticha]|uniref:1078_t:CDS:1 n=1 Tax=Ambispora leptoticha TaxID=144679 RepID=A0A9N8ZL98_9GLOM|nr:1078_t:CDS:10 [Ambispora leptoticha]